jgi:hypothetical protein
MPPEASFWDLVDEELKERQNGVGQPLLRLLLYRLMLGLL